jgi:hypothetical protein
MCPENKRHQMTNEHCRANFLICEPNGRLIRGSFFAHHILAAESMNDRFSRRTAIFFFAHFPRFLCCVRAQRGK